MMTRSSSPSLSRSLAMMALASASTLRACGGAKCSGTGDGVGVGEAAVLVATVVAAFDRHLKGNKRPPPANPSINVMMRKSRRDIQVLLLSRLY